MDDETLGDILADDESAKVDIPETNQVADMRAISAPIKTRTIQSLPICHK